MNFHKEVIGLKIKDVEAKEGINNDVKNLVHKISDTIDKELDVMAEMLDIYDIENFKKSICRHIIKYIESDAKIKIVKTKKDGKITEKELAELFVEYEEKAREVAGMTL